MKFSLRRLGWGSLISTCAAYWAGLAAVVLGPFLRYAVELAGAPGGHGSVSLSFDSGLLHLTALRDGAAVWSGTAPIGEFTLWVAGPPLAFWLLWMAVRPAPGSGGARREQPAFDALSEGAPPGWERDARAEHRVKVDPMDGGDR